MALANALFGGRVTITDADGVEELARQIAGKWPQRAVPPVTNDPPLVTMCSASRTHGAFDLEGLPRALVSEHL